MEVWISSCATPRLFKALTTAFTFTLLPSNAFVTEIASVSTATVKDTRSAATRMSDEPFTVTVGRFGQGGVSASVIEA